MFDYLDRDPVNVYINGQTVKMSLSALKALSQQKIEENTKLAKQRKIKWLKKHKKPIPPELGQESVPSEPQVEDPDTLLKKWIKLYSPKLKFEDFDKTGEGSYNFVEDENMVRLRTKIDKLKQILDANRDKSDDHVVPENGRKISKIKEEYEKRSLAKRIWERKFEVEEFIRANSGFSDSDIINKETGKTLSEYKNVKARLNSGLITLKGYES
mgnify:CR=1 FL=1